MESMSLIGVNSSVVGIGNHLLAYSIIVRICYELGAENM